MTGQEMVSASLRLIGALAANETPGASEAASALQALNDMLDSWSNERLTIFSIVREVFSLTAGKQTYTMGAGGDFATTRPMKIENAVIQLSVNSPTVEIPMRILNKDQYAGIIVKTVESSYPLYLYNDDAFPLANVSVWPVPSATCSAALYSSKPLSNISTLTTALSFPPGYQEAIKFNLAIRLAPEYGRQVPDAIAAIAMESKANIKRMNIKPYYLQVDDALRSKPAVFNWMTGEPT